MFRSEKTRYRFQSHISCSSDIRCLRFADENILIQIQTIRGTVILYCQGRGGWGEGGEESYWVWEILFASLKKMQIHTNKILDLRKYITYRLREMYHFYVCFSDGNHLTGDVHSAWTACVFRTMRGAWLSFSQLVQLQLQHMVTKKQATVCLHSTETTRELYLEED